MRLFHCNLGVTDLNPTNNLPTKERYSCVYQTLLKFFNVEPRALLPFFSSCAQNANYPVILVVCITWACETFAA